MSENLDKGTFGEQGAGFVLGAEGYFIVDGPGGSEGHPPNAPGPDGLAYNIVRDLLVIYDNKAWESSGNVGKGMAIDPAVKLARSLDALIAKVQNMPVLPARDRITDLLRQTRIAVTSKGVNPPPNVRIAISNFGGNSPGVTKGFAGRGVTFIDMMNAPAVPARPARIYFTKETIVLMAQPAYSDVEAYEARRNLVGAAAEVFRFGAQSANDWHLKSDIYCELERLAEPIAEAIVRGGGALVVININAMSPPGNVGMVVARSISSSYVVAHPNTNRREAVRRWENQPTYNRF